MSGSEEAQRAATALAGGQVVLVEAEQRRDRGYLVVAAETASPEKVALLIEHSSGFIRVALTPERAAHLELPMMVAGGTHSLSRMYTVTVDAAADVTTGISATDRARTIWVLGDPGSEPEDLIRPGHVLPICAAQGGVLERPGVSEAASDLARIAGLQPVVALGELIGESGELATDTEIDQFCQRHDVVRVSVRHVVDQRRHTEPTLALVGRRAVTLPHGPVEVLTYRDDYDAAEHTAVLFGQVRSHVALEVHQECLDGDVFASVDCRCRDELQAKLADLSSLPGGGILVYAGRERHAGQILNPSEQYAADVLSYLHPTVDEPDALGGVQAMHQRDGERGFGIAAEILRAMGVDTVDVGEPSADVRAILHSVGLRTGSLPYQ